MSGTSSYEELNSALDAQLARTAVFRRAAFHVHSPESYDWARDQAADAVLNERARLLASPSEFLDHLTASSDLVCVTDHMRSGFACQLASLAANRDDITVFPGVEVSRAERRVGRHPPLHARRVDRDDARRPSRQARGGERDYTSSVNVTRG